MMRLPRRRVSSPVLLLMGVLCALLTSATARGQDVFVSPTGNDANTGLSAALAVQSFQRAADIAATIPGAVVQFDGGEYLFEDTVVLGTQHSGVTFVAAPNMTPIFTSLVLVTGWQPLPGDPNIMVAPLPEDLTHVRYLQDENANWMERSAGPEFTTTEGGVATGCLECNNYDPLAWPGMSDMLYSGPALDWSRASQYDLRASTLPWHQEIMPIASFSGGRIATALPALYELRADTQEVPPQAWVLNTLEGIDTPGEWASLDGQIYLWPTNGTDDIFVPLLTELIRVDDGTADGNAAVSTPVTGITFDGITFTGGDFRPMATDDVAVQHDWAVVDEPDALLRIRNATNIIVRDCVFSRSGGTGFRADRLAQNIVVRDCFFSFLGRNGIVFAGRGPGYGDVNTGNEIAYNTMSFIGMEKWAAPAIMMDQSSSNRIHHNYISNTYFTGIAVVGPRQLSIAAHVEGTAGYPGREFHHNEWAPSVIQFAIDNGGILLGSQEAMRFVYSYDNRVEENALIDVCTGQNLYLNGQIYVSGTQRSLGPFDIKTNYVERNYMYDSFNHSVNDYAIYSDSDQDDCFYVGNMIHGVLNDDFEPFPTPIILAFGQWAESNTLGMGSIKVRANLTEASTFCNEPECMHTIGIDFVEEGQIVNGVGGTDARFLPIYEQMYRAICVENFPQVVSLPGAQPVRDRLVAVINNLGGTVSCLQPTAVEESSGRPVAALSAAHPNPFNPKTTLSFSLARREHVRLTIHDLAGRRVATIVDEVREPGQHRVEWLGRDDRDRPVASGVYLYRMETESNTQTRRVALVK